MKVIAGQLTDADRALIWESNRTGRRVLVATKHACVEYDSRGGAGCREPMQAVGVVMTWDYGSFKIGSPFGSFVTNIPWGSAVAVWWREDAPSEEEVDELLAGSSTSGDAS